MTSTFILDRAIRPPHVVARKPPPKQQELSRILRQTGGKTRNKRGRPRKKGLKSRHLGGGFKDLSMFYPFDLGEMILLG